MKNRRTHHRMRRSDVIAIHAPKVLFIWTTLVFIVAMFRGQSSIQKYLSLKDSEVVLAKTVNVLEDENIKLETEITNLKTSKSYAKKILRDKYHVTEEDEKIIYFAD